ncbi:MAG: hypothetical protein GX801_02315 [Fibrobacter sp.]|nr:hypothetical protein [Fibrobacter sp.]
MKAKKGMSLPIVLGMLLLATIVGIAIHNKLSQYNQSSGAEYHQSSAYESAKGGLSALRSWMSYHAAEAQGVFMQYDNYRLAAGSDPVIMEVFPQGDLATGSNQDYRVFWIDQHSADGSDQISAKVQVVGYGQDGSEAVITAVIQLARMQTSAVPTVISNTRREYIGDDDAIYIQGTNSDLTGGHGLTAHGSLYAGGGFTQSHLTVDNDLVIGEMPTECQMTNGKMLVKGNALIMGCFKTQNDGIEVYGSLRIKGIDALAPIEVGTVDGGDLFVDEIHGLANNNLVVNRKNGKGGNIFIASKLHANGRTIKADRDIIVGKEGGFSSFSLSLDNKANLIATRNMWNVRANDHDQTSKYFQYSGDYGFVSGGFVASQIKPLKWGVMPYIWPSYGPPYGPPTPSPQSRVERADSLNYLLAKLNEGGKSKAAPYNLSQDTVDKYLNISGSRHTWSWYKSEVGSSCVWSNQDYITPLEMDCIHTWVTNNKPQWLKEGYLFMDIAEMKNIPESVPTKLTYNYVIYSSNPPNPARIYGNTADSRIIYWFPNGAAQARVVTPDREIYGIIYSGGMFDVGGNDNIRIHGQMLAVDGGAIKTNGGGIEAWHDKEVLSDLASQTGMMEGPAISDPSTGESSENVEMVTTYSLVSPYLNVDTKSQYLQADLIDTASAEPLGPSVVFVPNYAFVKKDENLEVRDIMGRTNVDTLWLFGASKESCSIGLDSLYGDDWSIEGTHLIRFRLSCGGKTNKHIFFRVISGDKASIPKSSAVVLPPSSSSMQEVEPSSPSEEASSASVDTIAYSSESVAPSSASAPSSSSVAPSSSSVAEPSSSSEAVEESSSSLELIEIIGSNAPVDGIQDGTHNIFITVPGWGNKTTGTFRCNGTKSNTTIKIDIGGVTGTITGWHGTVANVPVDVMGTITVTNGPANCWIDW